MLFRVLAAAWVHGHLWGLEITGFPSLFLSLLCFQVCAFAWVQIQSASNSLTWAKGLLLSSQIPTAALLVDKDLLFYFFSVL